MTIRQLINQGTLFEGEYQLIFFFSVSLSGIGCWGLGTGKPFFATGAEHDKLLPDVEVKQRKAFTSYFPAPSLLLIHFVSPQN